MQAQGEIKMRSRKTGRRAQAAWLVLTMASVGVVRAQAVAVDAPAAAVLPALAAPATPEEFPGEIVREIDDPSTGGRWLLMRDAAHPAGPGRMVLVADGKAAADRVTAASMWRLRASRLFVIRAGDALIVEEHTPVVDARLEAVALGPASAGAEFNVRLKIGGKVLRAVALGPGRAAFARQNGAQP